MYCVVILFVSWLLGLFCEIGMFIYLGMLVGYCLLLVLYFVVLLDLVNVMLWFINWFYVMVMWVKGGGFLFIFLDVFLNMFLLIVCVFFSGVLDEDMSLGLFLFWKVGGRKWLNLVLVEFLVMLYRLLYVLLNVW